MTIHELIKNITETDVFISRFLSLAEQNMIPKELLSSQKVLLEGGIKYSEKKRLLINHADDIVGFQFSSNQEHSHQDILGSLLGLGISYDSIGDILPNRQMFVCTKEVSNIIKEEFRFVGKDLIALKEVDPKLFEKEIKFDCHEVIASSHRVDVIVSKITSINRKNTSYMFEKKLVKINHVHINKSFKQIKNEDVLSIRGFGRFKILITDRKTKGNNSILQICKFV
jgi:RNA-binding protein YlmH